MLFHFYILLVRISHHGIMIEVWIMPKYSNNMTSMYQEALDISSNPRLQQSPNVEALETLFGNPSIFKRNDCVTIYY